MLKETNRRRVDLIVPTGWNQCTTEQLETIAQILLRRMAMQDRYHPYDPLQMKTEVFFALAGLQVMEQQEQSDATNTNPSNDTNTGDDRFKVCLRGDRHWFTMSVWQVHSFVNQHLGWLDDFTGLWRFPYDDLGSYSVGHWSWTKAPLRWLGLAKPLPRLHGPAPLLDGMTWRQYRFASDWITSYTDIENMKLKVAQSAVQRVDGSRLAMLNAQSAEAREGFLRALFDVIDLPRTPRQLRHLRPDQFQLCLIWWQSMMKEMQAKYKRCFKTGSTKDDPSKASQLPIDLYTRSTATLQDKYHLTEDEINRQPCRVILQHLEDMAREAEELEKINRQHKSHRK